MQAAFFRLFFIAIVFPRGEKAHRAEQNQAFWHIALRRDGQPQVRGFLRVGRIQQGFPIGFQPSVKAAGQGFLHGIVLAEGILVFKNPVGEQFMMVDLNGAGGLHAAIVFVNRQIPNQRPQIIARIGLIQPAAVDDFGCPARFCQHVLQNFRHDDMFERFVAVVFSEREFERRSLPRIAFYLWEQRCRLLFCIL